jgi:hypothetical protein
MDVRDRWFALLPSDHQAASNAWGGFAIFLCTAGRLGNLFLGLWVLAAGWAIVSTEGLSVWLGWVGLVACIS